MRTMLLAFCIGILIGKVLLELERFINTTCAIHVKPSKNKTKKVHKLHSHPMTEYRGNIPQDKLLEFEELFSQTRAYRNGIHVIVPKSELNKLKINENMSKIIVDEKKYERIKVKGKENCNDGDLAKDVKSLASVPYYWQKGKVLKYCENPSHAICKEVKT